MICARAHGSVDVQIQQISQDIAENPRNPQLYLKRGELHRVNCDLKAALADFVRAEQLAPEMIEVEFSRGRLFYEAGVFESAQQSLNHFLKVHPNHPEALIIRARTHNKLKQKQQAVRDYSDAITLLSAPKPELFIERARAEAEISRRHIARALRGLDEGMRRYGALVALQLAAIDLELKRKNYNAALQRLETIIRQSDRKEVWLLQRGEILLLAGRGAAARQTFAAALGEIESLPDYLRGTRALQDLETRVRLSLAQIPELRHQ